MMPLGVHQAPSVQGAAWTPSGQPWYLADYYVTPSAVGLDATGRLETLADISGNGRHASQPREAERLPYSPSDPRAGDRPAMGFTASNQFGGIGTPLMPGFGRFYAVLGYRSGVDTSFDGYNTVVSNDDPQTDANRFMSRLNGNGWHSSYDGPPRLNGAPSDAPLPMPLSVLVGTLPSGVNLDLNLYIGGNRRRGSRGWTGPICRFVVTTRGEPDDDRDRMEGMLAHEFGIESSLAAGHPYRAAPP